jgi:outer membrane biosynthesis protein TonB
MMSMASRAWGKSLCALALVVAVAACSGESDQSGPKAGEPAGEVIELSGAPAVERGGERIALAVGDKVFGTDTVVTGDDGSVTIRLFHNEARWTLAAGKRKRIDSSVAWRAPKTAAGGLLAAGDQTESTAAAGRHAEKEAADTRDTASLVPGGADEPAMEEGKMGAPAAAPPAQPAPAATAPPPPPPAPAKAAPKPRRKMSKRSPARKKRSSRSSGSSGSSGDPLGGLGLEGTGRGGGGTGSGTIGLGTTGTIGKGGGGGTGSGYGRGSGAGSGGRTAKAPKIRPGGASVSGSLDKEIIRRVIRQHQAQFRYCYQLELNKQPDAKGLVKISFVIGTDGSVTSASAIATGGAAMERAARCVASKLKTMKFPKPKSGTVKVSYPFNFSPG